MVMRFPFPQMESFAYVAGGSRLGDRKNLEKTGRPSEKKKRKNKGRVDYATLVTKPGEYPNEDTQVRFFPSTKTLRRGYEKYKNILYWTKIKY